MTTTDNLGPADIGTVIEITVAPWGEPGRTFAGWSGLGGTVLGLLVAVERGPVESRYLIHPDDIGDEVTTVHLEGLAPLTFPSSRLAAVRR